MPRARRKADPVVTRLRLACAALFGIGVFLILQPFFPSIGYTLRTALPVRADVPMLPAFPKPNESVVPTINAESTLTIPKIGVEISVVEGDDEHALDLGAWRLPTTSMNPKVGNMAIAAHRYKRRPPASETFYLLDKLVPGDLITLQWHGLPYAYVVADTHVVAPSAVEVLAPSRTPTLTLITCTPLFSTAQRLVVTAHLL